MHVRNLYNERGSSRKYLPGIEVPGNQQNSNFQFSQLRRTINVLLYHSKQEPSSANSSPAHPIRPQLLYISPFQKRCESIPTLVHAVWIGGGGGGPLSRLALVRLSSGSIPERPIFLNRYAVTFLFKIYPQANINVLRAQVKRFWHAISFSSDNSRLERCADK